VSPSWILLYGSYADGAVGSALKKAMTWGLNQGQAAAEEMGYIPLPDNIVSKATEAVVGIQ
jgi:phosphate transport system substrate-binding protein